LDASYTAADEIEGKALPIAMRKMIAHARCDRTPALNSRAIPIVIAPVPACRATVMNARLP
jgi:hypothetical protein